MTNPQNRPERTQRLPERPFRVLLLVSDLDEAQILLPFAEAVVRERRGQLLIQHVMIVLDTVSLSESAANASRFREALGGLLAEKIDIPATLKTTVRTAGEAWEGIWEFVNQEAIDMLILGWETIAAAGVPIEELIDTWLVSPPCDVIAIRAVGQENASWEWSQVKHILLPLRGGPGSALTLRAGYALAQLAGAKITLMHAAVPGAPETELQYQEEFTPALHELERVTRSVTVKGDILQAILEEARDHQVVVMGAPLPSGQRRPDSWSARLLEKLAASLDSTIMLVKDHNPAGELARKSTAARVDRPVAVIVDKWFAENTFHSREFADLSRLIALKEEQGLTISLGLPALNEEETVGNVIQTVKTSLMEEFPLLDEIVLIDSNSVDRTREIARELGIPVYIHQEVLPQYGAYSGKGETLWKSLHVLNGDIVAWIDTDIKNIHPRFVYGILGPLLRDTHIQYVKGFYRRPLWEGDKLVAGGGGRVTELAARPFFNLFFRELSGLIQPLSGEYAGRRKALECLPFFTGYGVETGLLIDFLNHFGLSAIAQVDLLERIHHSQPLPSLSKMSFAIMQVVFRRLEKRHDVHLLEEASLTMNLIRYGKNRRYYLEPVEVREGERPAIITLPEYRQKRGIPAAEEESVEDVRQARRSPNERGMS